MQNKSTAMKKLQNILYQKEFNKDMSAISTDRKFQVRILKPHIKTATETIIEEYKFLQVGNMNRNEKIRTYNFSRHMVTDHRLGSSVTVRKDTLYFTLN